MASIGPIGCAMIMLATAWIAARRFISYKLRWTRQRKRHGRLLARATVRKLRPLPRGVNAPKHGSLSRWKAARRACGCSRSSWPSRVGAQPYEPTRAALPLRWKSFGGYAHGHEKAPRDGSTGLTVATG